MSTRSTQIGLKPALGTIRRCAGTARAREHTQGRYPQIQLPEAEEEGKKQTEKA